MTAEMDVHRDTYESEVPKCEVLNVNGNHKENENGNGNGISKDDTDGSYVLVTGSDAIGPEDLVESDHNGGFPVGESEGNPQPQLLSKASEETQSLNPEEMAVEGEESITQMIALTSCDLQSDKDPKLAKEDALRDPSTESESDSMPSLLDLASKVPACHAQDSTPEYLAQQQNGSPENGQVLPAPVIWQLENELATQVVNADSVSDVDDGDGLPSVHTQEGISEPIVSDNFGDTPGDYGPCENAGTCDKVPIENGESVSTVADDDAIGCPDGENEDAPTCAVDVARPGTDAVRFNDKSTESSIPCPLEHSESATEAESGRIIDDGLLVFPANHAISDQNTKPVVKSELDDTLSSCPGNAAITEPKLEVESERAAAVDDSLSSCRADDAISECNSKLQVESQSVLVDDDTLSSFPADDTMSEPNSKLELESVSAPVVDQTLSSFPANATTSERNSESEVESKITLIVDCCSTNDEISDVYSQSEIESESVARVDDTLSSCPADDAISELNPKSEIESENAPNVDDTLLSLPSNDTISESKISHGCIGCEEKVSNDAMDVDSTLPNVEVEFAASPPISVAENNADEAGLPARTDADDKPGCEVHSTSATRSRDIPDNDDNASESRVLDNSSVENGRPLNCNLDDVQIESDLKPTGQVVESAEGNRYEASTSYQEVSTPDTLEGQNKVAEVEKRPFYFLIRIPRYDDENLKEQIRHSQLLVEERTKIRDAVRSKYQMKKATRKEYSDDVETSKSEEDTARNLFEAKRQEMDPVQSMVDKMKNAISVEDIDNKIRNMEYIMEHETLPLKKEKEYIREIKQLKQFRARFSSNLGKHDEVQQALEQKDQIEQSLKVLRKEKGLLRENLLKAEAVTQAAKKKFNEQKLLLNELYSQFKAADDIRQEAYAHVQSLRKQQYEKNKYFWKYKDDAKAATNLALSGDREQLQHFCFNQVEAVMEVWNANDDFRKEYIRCNNRSTLRRLRTSDGRALGPDEDPPVIPDIVRGNKDKLAPVLSTPEQAKQVAPVESKKRDEESATEVVPQQSATEVVPQQNEIAKPKKPAKLASSEISPATASGRDEIEDETVEDLKPTTEEEELARKAEESREEEEAARLREQRRLEEIAKAKEAQERKKRVAEKAQARAAIRAQKEAEEKEKEREKRLRKKERKKATATQATNGITDAESAPESSSETPIETPEEYETREKPMTVTKRSQKSSQFTKQPKVKSIPLPLRNRSKRRMQPWMWALIAMLVMAALVLLGNGGSSHFKFLVEKFF